MVVRVLGEEGTHLNAVVDEWSELLTGHHNPAHKWRDVECLDDLQVADDDGIAFIAA